MVSRFCQTQRGWNTERAAFQGTSILDFPCKGYIDAKAGVPVTVSYESSMPVK